MLSEGCSEFTPPPKLSRGRCKCPPTIAAQLPHHCPGARTTIQRQRPQLLLVVACPMSYPIHIKVLTECNPALRWPGWVGAGHVRLCTKATTPRPGAMLSIYRVWPRLIPATALPMMCVDCSEVLRTCRLGLGGFGRLGKGWVLSPQQGHPRTFGKIVHTYWVG